MYTSSMETPERDKLHPLTIFCNEVGVGTCCSGCHEKKYRITVYPYSIYSEGKPDPLPDLGLGIHAEVCCGRYEAVRELPRAYWLQLYGRKHGWSDAHTAQLVTAPMDRFFKVWAEIGSYYWRSQNPTASAELRRNSGTNSRPVGVSRGPSKVSKCPACGQRWNGEVCDNCGHGAGI